MYRWSIQLLLAKDGLQSEVALSSLSDHSRNGNDVRLGEVNTSLVVELADGDPNGATVLGVDNAIGVLALPGEVDVGELTLIVDASLHHALLVG